MRARIGGGMLKQGISTRCKQTLLGQILQQFLDRLGAKSIRRVEQDQIKGAARHTTARGTHQHVARHHAPTRTVTAERLDILGNEPRGVAIDLKRRERAGPTREHLDT